MAEQASGGPSLAEESCFRAREFIIAQCSSGMQFRKRLELRNQIGVRLVCGCACRNRRGDRRLSRGSLVDLPDDLLRLCSLRLRARTALGDVSHSIADYFRSDRGPQKASTCHNTILGVCFGQRETDKPASPICWSELHEPPA